MTGNLENILNKTIKPFWLKSTRVTIDIIKELFAETELPKNEKIKLYSIAWEMLKEQMKYEKRANFSSTYFWVSFTNILRILLLGISEKEIKIENYAERYQKIK